MIESQSFRGLEVSMGIEFLATLGLTPEEKKKLANLGASNASALLSLTQAAPEAFENLLGKKRAGIIVENLRNQLTPEERERLSKSPPPKRFSLGALLGGAREALPPPKFDIEERDRLFKELQSLRELDSPTRAQKERIADLERQLNVLLESQ